MNYQNEILPHALIFHILGLAAVSIIGSSMLQSRLGDELGGSTPMCNGNGATLPHIL